MRTIGAFTGGLASSWRRGRDWAEEQPLGGRSVLAVWCLSALVGWVGTMLLVWASNAVAG